MEITIMVRILPINVDKKFVHTRPRLPWPLLNGDWVSLTMSMSKTQIWATISARRLACYVPWILAKNICHKSQWAPAAPIDREWIRSWFFFYKWQYNRRMKYLLFAISVSGDHRKGHLTCQCHWGIYNLTREVFRGNIPQRCEIAWNSLAWYGLAYHALLWYGLACYGLAWCECPLILRIRPMSCHLRRLPSNWYWGKCWWWQWNDNGGVGEMIMVGLKQRIWWWCWPGGGSPKVYQYNH